MKLNYSVILALVAMSGVSHAAIYVNFDGSQAGAGPATGSPFGVTSASWINTGNVATDAVGTSVGATTVTWSSANTWGANTAPTSDDGSVFGGYLDDSAGAAPSVSIIGLDAEFGVGSSYLVSVYGFADNAATNNVGDFTIDGIAVTTGSITARMNGNSGIATLVTSGDTLDFSGLVDGSAATRSTISGFSITAVPEPSAAFLLGLGGIALILRRRK